MDKNKKCLRCHKIIDIHKEIAWAFSAANWMPLTNDGKGLVVYLCPKCHKRALKRTFKVRIIKLKIYFYGRLAYYIDRYIVK